MFLSERCEFPMAPCLARKKNLMTAHVSMLLKSHASPDMLPFSLCNKKTCNSPNEQAPLSNNTIDSILRHWEVGQAKDLSASPRISGRNLRNDIKTEPIKTWDDFNYACSVVITKISQWHKRLHARFLIYNFVWQPQEQGIFLDTFILLPCNVRTIFIKTN